MENVIRDLRDKAKTSPKKIIFPEGSDERVVKAVEQIEKEKIAYPILLAPDKLDPKKQEEFSNIFCQIKKKATLDGARELMREPLYYAAMMTRLGYADGFVAGAVYTTSSVIRSAIRCLEIDTFYNFVSSCFIMHVPKCGYGESGLFVYADCAVTPYPTSEQLATTTLLSAKFAETVLNITPRVALLSFSTKGSAKIGNVNKIREALGIVKSKDPNLLIDGEFQADSAIVPEVAKRKVSGNSVAGKANVLIFPNLDAGNICYKLTERLAKARAIGPIMLGTVQPCSDLSRGCGIEDVIDCTAVTVIRAQEKEKIESR